MDTNLIGSIQLVRAVLPYMREQGQGRILQVSSLGGQVTIPGSSLSHATKWGIEGFMETVAQEAAVFGIGCTIVEPGSARTGFRDRSARVGPRIPAYDASPSRRIKDILDGTSLHSPGDPGKMVDAMIAGVVEEPAPLRLALGSDSYQHITRTLSTRLAQLQAQRDLACSTDCADRGNGPHFLRPQEPASIGLPVVRWRAGAAPCGRCPRRRSRRARCVQASRSVRMGVFVRLCLASGRARRRRPGQDR
ncbi:SDR family NAD(P)-dependent oxidoreductase [Streptomyces scabichelini]|uniref:SDR family NAD(P)-dependent oxidoreductase n=1 Tax=Streptomyces scabichelini TaxID=2711217 RepID=UPI0030BA1344